MIQLVWGGIFEGKTPSINRLEGAFSISKGNHAEPAMLQTWYQYGRGVKVPV